MPQNILMKRILGILVGIPLTLLLLYLVDILPNKWAGAFVAGYLFIAAIIVLGDLKRSLLFLLIIGIPLDLGLLLVSRGQSRIANSGIYLSLVDISILALILLRLTGLKLNEVTEGKWLDSFRKLTTPALCFLGANILSLLVSGDKTWCVYGIVNVVKLFGLFFVVANSIKTKREIKYVMSFMVISVFIQSSIYLIQHYTHTDFDVLGQSQVSSEFYGEARGRGLMGQANASGNFFSASLVLIASLYLIERRAFVKTLVGITMGLGVCALIITLTRIAWLSLMVSGMILIMIGFKQKWLKFWTVIPVLVVLVMVLIGFWGSIADRFEKDDEGSAYSRIPSMILMTRIIRDHPILGVGTNNYTDVRERYLTKDVGEALHYAHNLYLLILVETGMVGLVSYMWFLYEILKDGIKSMRSKDWFKSKLAAGASMSIFTICIANLTNGNVSGPVANLMWFLAGFIAAIGGVLKEDAL